MSGVVPTSMSGRVLDDDIAVNDIEKDAKMENADVIRRAHVEAAAVEDAYARKVYLFNKILNEEIGMSKWQWGLLMVSGVGWLVDNAWLQLIAVILPQVQVEFYTTDYTNDHVYASSPKWVSFSLFLGLFIGATFWGWAADVIGRRLSFNATLLICGVFATAAGAAPNFRTLAVMVGLSGVGIGGSLPVDGMLFLEFLPGNKQYLLTLLSVFWSLGQLLTSLLGWAFMTNWSCTTHEACEGNRTWQGWMADNVGWRYVIFTTGAYTLFLFFLRFVVFRIPESPKFYLSKGRDAEAIEAMHEVARLCGKPLPEGYLTVAKLRHIAGEPVDMVDEVPKVQKGSGVFGYFKHWLLDIKYNFKHTKRISPIAQMSPLFSNFALGYTTSMTWFLWFLIGLAYPLFNAFILIYLKGNNEDSMSRTYRNYVIISSCGVPGSVFGAWMVTWPRSGRRGAMALGTILSGVFLFGFTGVGKSSVGQLAFYSVTSFFENIMYGVLYCYTPESFPAPLRGTADGIASMLNRVAGVIATLIALFTTGTNNASAPVYTSAALFVAAGLLMLTLRVETAGRTSI